MLIFSNYDTHTFINMTHETIKVRPCTLTESQITLASCNQSQHAEVNKPPKLEAWKQSSLCEVFWSKCRELLKEEFCLYILLWDLFLIQ